MSRNDSPRPPGVMMKKILICIDRDGTLIHDTREHLFLGRDNDC